MFGKDFNDIFREFDRMMAQFDNRMNSTWKSSSSINLDGWDKEVYQNEDGTIHITSFTRTSNSKPESKPGLTKLKRDLEIAIEKEDFESAVKLRDQIKKFEKNQESIDKLESELKKMISEQNFEKAIEIRDELKKLRS